MLLLTDALARIVMLLLTNALTRIGPATPQSPLTSACARQLKVEAQARVFENMHSDKQSPTHCSYQPAPAN